LAIGKLVAPSLCAHFQTDESAAIRGSRSEATCAFLELEEVYNTGRAKSRGLQASKIIRQSMSSRPSAARAGV
jgi:hypothetical protein